MFETLTNNRCIVDTFDRNFQYDVAHVSLANAADLMLIAPATANVIAKLAHGLADDMLTTVTLAAHCPKLVAPAMNTHMLENPITQDNLKTLEHYGFTVIPSGSALLACVAVNISSRQLADVNFIAMVRGAIHESGIRPAQLEIEVTESVLIESIEESIKKLVALKELGVKIALDDFGTGYSSLTYLRRLPVGTLKVDKSFIDDILADRVQGDLVGYIIDMAHTLNLSVVAEGVESEAQLEKLHEYDCDCIQGYVFSRPLPAAEALRLLE